MVIADGSGLRFVAGLEEVNTDDPILALRVKMFMARAKLVERRAREVGCARVEVSDLLESLLRKALNKEEDLSSIMKELSRALDILNEIASLCESSRVRIGSLEVIRIKRLEDLNSLKNKINREVNNKALGLEYPYVKLKDSIVVYAKIVNNGDDPLHVVSARLYSKRENNVLELISVTKLDKDIPGHGYMELSYNLKPGTYILEIGYITRGRRLARDTFSMLLEPKPVRNWVALLGAPLEAKLEEMRGAPLGKEQRRKLMLRGRLSKYECIELIYPSPSCNLSDYKYAILKCIDSSGEVYVAKMPTKVLSSLLGSESPTQLVSKEELDRFVRELELFERRLVNLGHPHLLRLMDADEEACTLVWEYCPYGSLRDLIVKGLRPTAREVAKIGVQVGAALMQLHQAFGGPHMDVKPENLLIDSKRIVKLGDFESMVRSQSQLRTTPQYTAPEVFNRGAEPKSDVYSLALTLAELVTGYTPRRRYGTDLVEVVKSYENMERGLKEALLTALEEDPNRRISLEELIETMWKLYALPNPV